MAGKARRLALAGALIALSGCAGGAGDRDERLRLTTPGVKPIAVRDLPQGSADRPPGRVTKVIPLPAGPIGVGYGGGAVWATRDDGVVSRIDPGSGKVQRTRRVGERPIRVAVDGLGAWIANADSDTVSELDAHSGRVRRTVAVGDRPSSVAVTPDAVWVATDRGGTLERIDRRRGEVVARIDIGAAIGTGRQVAAGLGAIWVTGTDNVSRVDPATNAITATVRVDSPNDVTVGHDAVWVASIDDDVLTRIDPVRNRVAGRLQVGHLPSAVAVAAGFLWVVNNADATVTQLDETTGEVTGEIEVGAYSYDVAAGGGAIWVQSYGEQAVYRIDPRRGT